jgi:hypothetical protein
MVGYNNGVGHCMFGAVSKEVTVSAADTTAVLSAGGLVVMIDLASNTFSFQELGFDGCIQLLSCSGHYSMKPRDPDVVLEPSF